MSRSRSASRAKYFSIKARFIYFLLFLLTSFRPGSVIVDFILYFKTAVTPEKGIENLRVAIFSNGTFGDFQAKDVVLHSEESTKSTTTTGIKGLGILSINVIGVACMLLLSFPCSFSLLFFCSSFSCFLFYIFLSHLFVVSRLPAIRKL